MPLARQPMPDVVVVIPGILGSVLELDGHDIWGTPGTIAWNLRKLGQHLKLPPGLGDEEPQGNRVRAPRLMPRLLLIPTFWGVDGYGVIVDFLKSRFTIVEPDDRQAGNLILFSYDWRLSNVVSARRPEDRVVPELERWRKHNGNPDARLVLICHSMGGLVARWFLEVRGGKSLTRRLVTIGTPYQGSVNALTALVNGVSPGLGPLRIELTDLARSLP